MAKLTFLSLGGGQESTLLFHLYQHDEEFRAVYAPEDFVVGMSNTGDEFEETYEHVDRLRLLAHQWEIPFFLLNPEHGFHSLAWPGLIQYYERNQAIGSKSYPKSCTDQLKIRVLYRWLANYVAERYNLPRSGGRYRGKRPLVEFAQQYGKIDVLIGIAKGEEKRLGGEMPGKWAGLAINRRYPLVELGYDRAACQQKITELGYHVPFPSNCKRCPYLNDVELLYLYRFHRADYEEWVLLERAKLDANIHMGIDNFGVFGRLTLPEKLVQVQAKYGDWTDARLREYRMSHGHCVASKY